MCSSKDFHVIWYDLDTWPTNIFEGHCISFNQRHHVGDLWVRFEQRERKYVPNISFDSALTSQLTLEIGSSSWSPDRVQLKVHMPWKKIFPLSDIILTILTIYNYYSRSLHIIWTLSQIVLWRGKLCPEQGCYNYIILLWP